MRIHWLCIRICIRLKFVFQFINVVLCYNKSNKPLFVIILWKIQSSLYEIWMELKMSQTIFYQYMVLL
ncbi:hypothetical protein SAMN05192581_105229 [Bacteroides ovatus]|uniref:Uncharacterized protein n=1 Tax=Bacteroides ovatus TaxID=28116 RepID=A0A1G6GA46_BACOV|nr:hypothetical protein SAMN05192581_105229 [Bacteroides ovatus]